MTAAIFNFDRSDRKEVMMGLLGRLPREQRIAWLRWCCLKATASNPVRVELMPVVGDPKEVYLDWLSLCTQYKLDAVASRAELESRVRRFGVALSFTAGGTIIEG